MAQQLAAREHAVIEEDALIERLRHRDQAAFEDLFPRYYGQLYRVLCHLVGSREEAEDWPRRRSWRCTTSCPRQGWARRCSPGCAGYG